MHRRLFIGVGLMVLSQLTGINVVMYVGRCNRAVPGLSWRKDQCRGYF